MGPGHGGQVLQGHVLSVVYQAHAGQLQRMASVAQTEAEYRLAALVFLPGLKRQHVVPPLLSRAYLTKQALVPRRAGVLKVDAQAHLSACVRRVDCPHVELHQQHVALCDMRAVWNNRLSFPEVVGHVLKDDPQRFGERLAREFYTLGVG